MSDGFDHGQFIAAQRNLSAGERRVLRRDPAIVASAFGLDVEPSMAGDWGFWDQTTLCLREPLLGAAGRPGVRRVLEIGPGPAATLSVMLAKQLPTLEITCAELNPEFIGTCRACIKRNGVCVEVVHSDMASKLDPAFDLVFMNPPYVPTATVEERSIRRGSSEHLAVCGGDSGLAVVSRFLEEVPRVLSDHGTALLGINTLHVPDAEIMRVIGASVFRTCHRYYPEQKVEPAGPYAQVYQLALAR